MVVDESHLKIGLQLPLFYFLAYAVAVLVKQLEMHTKLRLQFSMPGELSTLYQVQVLFYPPGSETLAKISINLIRPDSFVFFYERFIVKNSYVFKKHTFNLLQCHHL